MLVEGRVQLGEVSAEAAVRAGLGQAGIADIDRRPSEKVLGRAADPAQDDQ
jgi:hypothetical protein